MKSLFQKPRPDYVRLNESNFQIGQQLFPMLSGFIQEVSGVRKFFQDRKLKCYSLDNKTGKDGKYCSICTDLPQCRMKIRITLLLLCRKEPLPAILEIDYYYARSLEHLLEQIPQNQLSKTKVAMKIVYDENNRKEVEFWTVD